MAAGTMRARTNVASSATPDGHPETDRFDDHDISESEASEHGDR
jgi:hypothetical protein